MNFNSIFSKLILEDSEAGEIFICANDMKDIRRKPITSSLLNVLSASDLTIIIPIGMCLPMTCTHSYHTVEIKLISK